MSKSSEHDLGLPHDLRVLSDRRRVLKWMTAAGAAGFLNGCDGQAFFPSRQPEITGAGADGRECVVDPEETAGPFPADGSNSAHGTLANVLDDSGIRRRDIRPDIGEESSAVAAGVQLDMTATLVGVSQSCAPLKDHVLYLWHCDAHGAYSIYNVAERTYLRGVGVSDEQGRIAFTTIIPGCYRGRYPHMHFEVYPSLAAATDYRKRILTSQLIIPDTVCRAVYAQHKAYGASQSNFSAVPFGRDMIFSDNTPKQIAAQTIQMTGNPDDGYRGSVTIGVQI